MSSPSPVESELNAADQPQVLDPVSVTGDTNITFDDMEELENQHREQAKAELKEKKELEKEVKDESKQPKKEAKEKTEAKGKEKVEDDDTEVDKSKASEVAKQVKKSHVIEAKAGDEIVKIPVDAKVQVKVDGKLEEVYLAELRDNYSGRAHLSRQATQFKKEQQSLTQERATLQKLAEDANNLLMEGNFYGFMDFVSEAMGADPLKVRNQVIPKLQAQFEELAGLSEVERKAKQIEQENEYWRKRQSRLSQDEQIRKSEAELRTEVESVMEKYGMTEEDFVKSYEELVEKGRIDVSKFTHDGAEVEAIHQVAQWYDTNKQIDRVETQLKEIAPDLPDEDRDQAVTDLVKIVLQEELSDDDLKTVITEVYGNQSEKNLAKKLEKANPNKSSKAVDPQTEPMDDVWDWDQL